MTIFQLYFRELNHDTHSPNPHSPIHQLISGLSGQITRVTALDAIPVSVADGNWNALTDNRTKFCFSCW